MFKLTIVVTTILVVFTYAAEMSPPYASMEKAAPLKYDLPIPVETHSTNNAETEKQPIYRAEERRAKIKPVQPMGSVVKHDMLADQPMPSADVNRADSMGGMGYAPVEVAYPDVAYAPGYGYDNGYAPSNSYEVYSNNPNNYILEPDTTVFSLLWSQMPDSRALVNFAGKSIVWLINSMLVLFLGSIMTVGLCSYTNLCTITFNGVGPIHEEMRSLMSAERLEKIGSAAEFVKNAIDKYQKIQKVTDASGRHRRAIFK